MRPGQSDRQPEFVHARGAEEDGEHREQALPLVGTAQWLQRSGPAWVVAFELGGHHCLGEQRPGFAERPLRQQDVVVDPVSLALAVDEEVVGNTHQPPDVLPQVHDRPRVTA